MSEKVMTPEEKTEYIVGKAMEIIMNSGDARNPGIRQDRRRRLRSS